MGDVPQPTPIPIRIVQDTKGVQEVKQVAAEGVVVGGKRNDMFYEAWDKFLALEPKRARTTSRPAAAVYGEKLELVASFGEGLHHRRNAAQSWSDAAEACKAKVALIVSECRRLNQKYRDAQFDLEADPYTLMSLGGRFPKAVEKIGMPPWVKRVGDIYPTPKFFPDDLQVTNVHQGSGGDCWFLAALIAASAKPALIEKLCVARDEAVGVYGFVFWRDGEWVYEVIDDKLYIKVGDDEELKVVKDWDKENKKGTSVRVTDPEKLRERFQQGGKALYFSYCESDETWLPLIEKAYAKAHGDYFAIEGGFASEGIEDVTGGVGVVLSPEEIMDKDKFWKDQLLRVNEKYLFGGGSRPKAEKGMIPAHAYAVLQAWEEGDVRLLKIRNPWGEVEWNGDWSDGSKLWTADMMTKLDHKFGDDGEFWISYEDFLKHFPCINRVRLFDDTWHISQRWTSVQVPWTVDYLDTKFQFNLTEGGPAVIVLCQPDDRFFLGLRGRFLFAMHFRVYREGDQDDWIVRSMHNSGNESVFTRSVSAEIDHLEPGTYNVIFKVTATRSPGAATAEEAIFKYATERKDKLLSVGRRFDYAMTKGNLRAMEGTVRRQRKQSDKDKKRREQIKVRKLNQQEKMRARKRKQRIELGMNQKRRELEVKQQAREQRKQQSQQTNGHGMDDCEDCRRAAESNKAAANNEATAKDSGYESPLELIQLEDDDFEWDSGMDGRLDSDVEDSEEQARARAASSPENGIFAADPWNAICVLGLRVYSPGAPVDIQILKGETDVYRQDSLAGLLQT